VLVQNILFAIEPAKTKTSELATDFTLLDLNNQKVSLSDFRGKPLILFFWTTWCPYCRRELKQLKVMHLEFSRSGTELLAINVEETKEKVQRFMKRLSLTYKVLLDEDAQVAINYAILGVPTYVYIDKEGRIASYGHYFSHNKYNEIILK
jgi:peroxiredoxin